MRYVKWNSFNPPRNPSGISLGGNYGNITKATSVHMVTVKPNGLFRCNG